MKLIIYWLPRILAALITAFWCGFILLSHGLSWESVLESGIWVLILIMTILAWRKEKLGQFGFIVFGFLYLILTWGRFRWHTYLLISGSLIITGILFLLSNQIKLTPRKKLSKPSESKKENDEGII